MEALTAIKQAITWGIHEQSSSILVAVAIALLGWVYVVSYKKPPGPSVLLGQTLPLLGDTLAVKKNPCAYFIDGYLRYGGVYKTSMLGLPIYVVLDPSAVREMLRGEGCTFSVPFKSFNALLEDWDHMVDSKQHDFWRKALSTALSHASIESYVPALAAIIQQNMHKWTEQGSVNLMEGTGDMALDFAIEVLVGVPLVHTDRAWFKHNMLQYFKGLYVVPLPLPGSTFSKAKAAKAALLEALERELESCVTAVLQEDPTAGEAIGVAAKLVHVDGAGKHALLHSDASLQFSQQHFAASMARLKERELTAPAAPASNGRRSHSSTADSHSRPTDAPAGNERSPKVAPLNMADAQLEVLRGQRRLSVSTAAMRVLGTLIGAVDTTRYQIFSVLSILAQLPEHREALRKEQQQVLATHGPDLTPAAVAAMPLLEASIKECTRLLSASRVVMRQAVQPLNLQDVAVPAGAYMIFSVDFLHAVEPTLWQGPRSIPAGRRVPVWMDWQEHLQEAFAPERWLGDSSSKPKHMFTFGMGPHLCLGMNLVFTEIKLLLALLLREGLEWHFADPDVLKKMTVFPGLKPQPGTDKLVITRKHAPLVGPSK